MNSKSSVSFNVDFVDSNVFLNVLSLLLSSLTVSFTVVSYVGGTCVVLICIW